MSTLGEELLKKYNKTLFYNKFKKGKLTKSNPNNQRNKKTTTAIFLIEYS